ncbi:MAG: hypothetical protein JSW35_11380 [Deltaproteobacteria bacterium]|nr:MAG: hypothetical protein JSW35_11380 [Deltaproteobacteria bacterium]
MKRLRHYWFTSVLLISCFVFMPGPGFADDTCVFAVTADDVPPNIVILLDNGAEMQQIEWHSSYDNSIDYTQTTDGVDNDSDGFIDEAGEDDVVGGAGSGFFNDNGYAIVSHGDSYYLVPILDSLEIGAYTDGLQADSSDTTLRTGTWTINGMTVTLPAQPSTVAVDGVIDNATYFRYSKNYLNWIFFSSGEGSYTEESTAGHDGSDLPNKSRFYWAKKAIFAVARLTANKAKFSIFNFTASAEGASNVQPLGMVVSTPLADLPENNTLDPSFVNNVNNMGTVTYSPLAEGLARVGGYYASSSSHIVGEYCQRSFVTVVSPGVSSEDQAAASQSSPASLSDYDGDSEAGGIGEGNIKADASIDAIPTNQNGSTYLDDVAYYLYANDIVGYQDGFQNVSTYTIGFMGNQLSNLFLINTANNGNGNLNLYDTTDPEYGRYHFTTESPNSLPSVLLDAINEIISETSSFTAPVVPVTRTTSGNRIYMAFFTPGEGNFWEGNVTKFGISEDNEIVDPVGNPATWPNGAMREDAEPYWATKDWADPTKGNYIHNSSRNIYTYLGSSTDLTDLTNEFKSTNSGLTAAILGNPTHTTEQIINYVRGADVFDEDGDSDTTENRAIITGDVLHSEPLIISYNSSTSMVYFGANDGMLHAVSDSDGTEAWAFIPPDQLARLKDVVEGSSHQYFVDSSPKVYINDVDGDGVIESGDGDQVILVCGERKGGTSYFAVDATDPSNPSFLWVIDQSTISELGESSAEPQFGVVKTTDEDTSGTPVFFIGGGYSSDNSMGKAVIAINVLTGAVVRTFKNNGSSITGMDYSFASSVSVLDSDSNGFVDKVYVGDLGGQLWRFGKFTDSEGNPLVFPTCEENINNWTAQIIFLSDPAHTRKFFYPPSVALEKEYDLVFMGTGDREDACNPSSSDRIYCVKDTHGSTTLGESDLVDVTDVAATPPDLSSETGDVDENGQVDQGWYIRLATGEKVLAEGAVFYKAFYIPTFTPNDDPCLPGGVGKSYALNYLTGEAVLDFGGGGPTRSYEIGGGIPSKPVIVITEEGQKLFISVGSTNPGAESEEVGAGIVAIDPLAPPRNIFYLWWIEL